MLNSLANLAIRRSRAVVVTAVLASIVAGALGAGVASRLDPYGDDDPATESVQADNRLDDAGFQDLGLIALVRGVDVSSPQTKHRVAVDWLAHLRGSSGRPHSRLLHTGSRDFVSADGRATYLAVDLKPTDDKEQQDAAKRIADRIDGAPGVTLGGPALAQEQVNKQVESDLRRAELLAFPFLFLLSLLFFRSGVAALLPPLIGGLAIVGTFLMLRVASELTSVSIFALNLVTGLGLGLAIDYSLFMVSRYREEIARSGPGARGDAADDGHRRADDRLLVADGGGRARLAVDLPAALPLLDGPRRLARRADRRGPGAGRPPAILALLGTRVNSLAPAFLQARAEREARPDRVGLLVPAVALRDAAAGPDRGRERDAADRARDPVLRRSSSPPSTRPCCQRRPAPARSTPRCKTEFPPHRDSPIRLASTAPTAPSSPSCATRSSASRASRRSIHRSASPAESPTWT